MTVEQKDQKGVVGVIMEKPELGKPHGFITAETVGFSDEETNDDVMFYLVRFLRPFRVFFNFKLEF